MKASVGTSGSIAIASSASTPSRVAAAIASNRAAPVSTARAWATRTRPASVSTGRKADRSNSAIPCTFSNVAMVWLIADCARPNRRPAAEKLPVSAIVTSTRS